MKKEFPRNINSVDVINETTSVCFVPELVFGGPATMNEASKKRYDKVLIYK